MLDRNPPTSRPQPTQPAPTADATHAPAPPARPPVRSARAATIVRWFGLDPLPRHHARARAHDLNRADPAASPARAPAPEAPLALPLAPGTITLVTGPSGAGKSTLLRHAQRATAAPHGPHPIDVPAARRVLDAPHAPGTADASNAPVPPATIWIDLATIALPDVPVVDCLFADDRPDVPNHDTGPDPTPPDAPYAPDPADANLRAALLALARVGLAEAWTYLRPPAALSDGQRWRLRLAIALDRAARITRGQPHARVVLVIDEFAALLDRVTGCVVARTLRRAVAPGANVAALVATSRHDLTRALAPDLIVSCDFGRIRMTPSPTIPRASAARGFAEQGAWTVDARPPSNQGACRVDARPHPAPLVPPSRKRTNTTTGGSMRKIIIASLALFALPALPVLTARADEPSGAVAPAPRGGNDRLLTEPRSPFEPPRSLFEFDPRPSRRPIMPLYPTIERELDRGNGRIESDVEFDLRLRQRDLDERRDVARDRSAYERLEERYDRTLRIEQQERRAEQQRRSDQRLETESERLAAERERFYRSAGIDVSGAAHDARQLKHLEVAYQRDVKQLKRDRAIALKRLANDDDLKGAARAEARAALDERYRTAQSARRERFAADRARVLGNE